MFHAIILLRNDLIIQTALNTLLRGQSLRWNFVANVTGRLWSGVLSLATVPIFVHLLGTSAFGIISLVGTLQAILALLDFGLAGTANREVAMARASRNQCQIADTIRTFELIYWTVALVIGFGFAGLSNWIANYWIAKQSLPPAEIQMAIILGGSALAARWPVALYTGVLQGLERQVTQNMILLLAATIRVVLTIAALVFASRTIYCFLIAQASANIIEVILTGYIARRLATGGDKGRFDLAIVRRVWRFAVGFNLVGTFGMLVSGAPQLLISKLLPLVNLTYYSIASTATGALLMVSLAAQTSLLPRLSFLWKQQDLHEIRRLCLAVQKLTVYLCVAPTMVLCLFPAQVLSLWTRSPEVVQHAQPLLPILAFAVLVNCALGASYNVVIASGHTRLPLMVNAISLPPMVGGCLLTIRAFGICGAAWCWLAFNLLCFVVYGRYCVTRIFRTGEGQFLYGFPLQFAFIGFGLSAISRLLLPISLGNSVLAVWLFTTMVLTYLAGVLTLKREERRIIAGVLKQYGLQVRALICRILVGPARVAL